MSEVPHQSSEGVRELYKLIWNGWRKQRLYGSNFNYPMEITNYFYLVINAD